MHRLAPRDVPGSQLSHDSFVCSLHIGSVTPHLYDLQIWHQDGQRGSSEKVMQGRQPFGPPNLCRNGSCGDLVEICCRFQHYCGGCASSNLGLRAGEPALRITMALRLRRRLVGRLLHQHLANPPPCVGKHILDFIMNDLGKLSVSMRWACILLCSGVQCEW